MPSRSQTGERFVKHYDSMSTMAAVHCLLSQIDVDLAAVCQRPSRTDKSMSLSK